MLTLERVSKTFGAVRALREVSLSVGPGEIVGLVGENGAGKSTLINILAGDLTMDRGRMLCKGEPVSFRHPSAARRHGVAVVHQEPHLCPALSIAENIFLGQEPRAVAHGWLDRAKMLERSRQLLSAYGYGHLDPQVRVASLNLASRYFVAISRALAHNFDLIVLDEPTAASSPAEAGRLLELLKVFRSQQRGVLLVSHRLSEIKLVADRVVVLRDGQVTGELIGQQIETETMVRLMVGRELQQEAKTAHRPGQLLLQVRALDALPYLHHIEMTLHEGEVVGLAGLVGSGRSRFARCLFGLQPYQSGEVMWHPDVMASAGSVGYLPEDRHAQGLVPTTTLFHNMLLPRRARARALSWLHLTEEREAAERQAQRLQVRTPSLDVHPGALSGGNQQKVMLAKWLLTGPRVLILDEPTRGVDVSARAEIHRIIRSLVDDARLGILIISSDMSELLALSHCIVVFAKGRVTATLDGAHATEEQVMRAAVN